MNRTIFLSYARGDDEPFVRRLYDDLKTNGFDVWFDRVSMPSRALTFHQEIRDAIAARERVVLVVGPKAVASQYVQQEWQFAWREAEKAVTPILRLGSYPIAIDELKLLHCEDFRVDEDYPIHLEQLVRMLREPPPRLGKLIAVPSLPSHYLTRSDRLEALRDALRADLDRPVVIGGAAARVGMHGMGGIGKSVLAAALARDREVRKAFPDGLVWVGLGTAPDLRAIMQRVYRDLGGEDSITTEEEGKTLIQDYLADKAVLLVLDNAWHRSDVDAFDVLGPRCRALVTTRDAGLLTALGGIHHIVELLSNRESRRLLAVTTGLVEAALPAEATALIRECGRLPLAIALCGGLIRKGMRWCDVALQLEKARIDRIVDRHAVEPQHRSIWHAIHVSVEALGAQERERFLELGIFSQDETVPQSAITTFWEHTSQLDDWDTSSLLTSLVERSLLQASHPAQGSLTGTCCYALHDLVYDYIQQSTPNQIHLHGTLLAAYARKCTAGWPSGPKDGYFFEHLLYHLLATGATEDVISLLSSIPWITAKIAATDNCNDLIHDYVYVLAKCSSSLQLDQRERIEAFRSFLERQGHRLENSLEAAIAIALEMPVGTLVREEALLLSKSGGSGQGFLFNRINVPSSDVNPRIRRVLRVTDQVRAVAISDGGTHCLISTEFGHPTYEGGVVQYWDLATAKLLHTFTRDSIVARTLRISPDGTRALSLDSDGSARLWKLQEQVVTELTAPFRVTGLCVNAGFDHAIVAGKPSEMILWDLDSEVSRKVPIETRDLWSFSLSADAQRVLIANSTLTLWDVNTGSRLSSTTLDWYGVEAVHVSADANMALGVSDCGKAGGNRSELVRRDLGSKKSSDAPQFDADGFMSSLCVSRDGKWALTGYFRRLVLWNLDTGKRHLDLASPAGGVRAAVLSPDAQFAISTQEFGFTSSYLKQETSVYIWDLQRDRTSPAQSEPPRRVPRASVDAVALCSESKLALSGAGTTFSGWDIETGERRFAFNCSGKVLAVATGTEPFAISVDERMECYDDPDYPRVRDCPVVVRLWDLQKQEVIHRHKLHDGPVNLLYLSDDASFSLTGNSFAYNDCDRRVNSNSETSLVRWNTRDGTAQALHGNWFKYCTEINPQIPDCAIVIPPGDKILIRRGLWDLKGPTLIQHLEGRPMEGEYDSEDSPTSLCASADGRFVAGEYGGDGMCYVWNLPSGDKHICFSVDHGISTMALSKAGDYLLVGSKNGLSFWHVHSGTKLATLPCEFAIKCVALSREPPWIAAAGDDGGNFMLFNLTHF